MSLSGYKFVTDVFAVASRKSKPNILHNVFCFSIAFAEV